MMTSGTRTFMILLNRKFCTPCVPVAPSAASRFLLIGSMLVLSARSNLSAFTISTVAVRQSFAVFLSSYGTISGYSLQSTTLVPNAWVKRELSLIFIPTLVPGLTTKLVMGLDSYILRFCSCRVQVRNPGFVIDLLNISFPLFLKRMLI